MGKAQARGMPLHAAMLSMVAINSSQPSSAVSTSKLLPLDSGEGLSHRDLNKRKHKRKKGKNAFPLVGGYEGDTGLSDSNPLRGIQLGKGKMESDWQRNSQANLEDEDGQSHSPFANFFREKKRGRDDAGGHDRIQKSQDGKESGEEEPSKKKKKKNKGKVEEILQSQGCDETRRTKNLTDQQHSGQSARDTPAARGIKTTGSVKSGGVDGKLARHRLDPHAEDKKGEIPWHPFETDYGDHFETGDAAYRDVAPLLERLAHVMGKPKSGLAIYDPYYCAGAVVSRLAALGFTNVYNKNEDCYKVWREKKMPSHDVVVTNPPFSGNHKERCLRQLVESGRPWACLLPNYCATKQYFQNMTQPCGDNLFFGVPKLLYEFDHPEGTGHQSSPFFSLWFIYFGTHSKDILHWYQHKYGGSKGLRLCSTVAQLGENKAVKIEKRGNPRQRKAARKKLMGSG